MKEHVHLYLDAPARESILSGRIMGYIPRKDSFPPLPLRIRNLGQPESEAQEIIHPRVDDMGKFQIDEQQDLLVTLTTNKEWALTSL